MFNPQFLALATALLAALSAGGLVAALLYPRLTRRSAAKARLQALLASAQSPRQGPALTDEERRKRAVEATLRDLESKVREENRGKPSLETRIREAGLSWHKRSYYLVAVGVWALSFAALALLGLALLPAAGLALIPALLLPRWYLRLRRNRRLKRFTSEFPNAVDVIVRGVKSGLPVVDCLKIIAREAQVPVRDEFKQVAEDQTLGMPLDEAVQRLARRVRLPETNFFAIVLTIQSRSGGNLSEALGNLSNVLRERKKMDAKIKAMSAEAKASGGIIAALPVVVAVLVYMTTPDYISLLFTTLTGNLVLAACAFWMSVGVFAMRKMINFDF